MTIKDIKVGDTIKFVAVGNSTSRAITIRSIAIRDDYAVIRAVGQSKILFLMESDGFEFIRHDASVAQRFAVVA